MAALFLFPTSSSSRCFRLNPDVVVVEVLLLNLLPDLVALSCESGMLSIEEGVSGEAEDAGRRQCVGEVVQRN